MKIETLFLSLVTKNYFLIASVEKAKEMVFISFNLCVLELNIDILKLNSFPITIQTD